MIWFRGALMCLGALISAGAPVPEVWKCPEITQEPVVECSCDMPHTLRCTGDRSAIQVIGRKLRVLNSASISLLDCTVQNVTFLTGSLLEGVTLHGLVISSGEIKEVHQTAFLGLGAPLQALGLPNNQLPLVPTLALTLLPELDRLDLSGNRLKNLNADSFRGLYNLSFIDLSNNAITKISPNTFTRMQLLRTLRLRGNRISILVFSKLEAFKSLEDLDVSKNSLVGPLDASTFPKMQLLKDLQAAHNSFSSIKIGCLAGLNNLTSLCLAFNQIDVIEDHAFVHLGTLINLDLSHNRIVAVSGASLAHLPRLTDLDLSHNFLRALTADLVVPLKSLQNLKLDDNDISIVASDALKPDRTLKRLTLSENPLNCDCSLSEFTTWLLNSSLSHDDKSSAVCATPPLLENGLLMEISSKQLLCGEDELAASMAPIFAPVKGHITLRKLYYDGENVTLEWNVDDSDLPYLCDAIFVYQETGSNEILLESLPLKCNSSALKNPNVLNVTVPNSYRLQHGLSYRYCVVLLEPSRSTEELSLVLGCSDTIPLVNLKLPNVTAIIASIKPNGLKVTVAISPPHECEVNVSVFRNNGVLAHKKLKCNSASYTFEDLCDKSYKVCANISNQKPVCVKVVESTLPKLFDISSIGVILILLSLTTGVSFITIMWVLFKNSRSNISTHQCFMPPEVEEQQHNRYIKLQATTKL